MDSFYTLSSVDDASDRTTLTTPSSTTHDTSRASYHINDISSFAENLQDAADRAFPNRGRSRYKTVNVCLIRWQDDELQVTSELDRLFHVFEKLYGFNTQLWLIPPRASQMQLTSMTCSFMQEFDAEENLFIVYYGGHGTINQARQSQWWSSRSPNSPHVDWSAIQALFATAVSDVLVLLDCCAAASSALGSGSNVMEAIAACGFETRAPPPGLYSFTNTLIEVLEEWANKPSFSAAMLHTEVLFVLKQKRPERGRDGRRLEWCSTPIHLVYTGDPKSSGIEVCSLKSEKSAQKVTSRLDCQRESRSTTYVDSMDLDEDSLSDALTACTVDGNYQVPHVLISIALEEDQADLDAHSCRRWLADFPALAKYATVEGVYRGNSTLVTMSLPVMIWDLLPENPACSFIAFVNTPNKFSESFSLADARNMYIHMLPEHDRGKVGSFRETGVPSFEIRTRPIPTASKRHRSLSRDSSYESDFSLVSSIHAPQTRITSKKPTGRKTKAKLFILGGSSGSEDEASHDSRQCLVDDEFVTDDSENFDGAMDTENSSNWEGADVDSTGSTGEEVCQRIDSTAARPPPKSLITTMLHQNGRARSLTAALPGSAGRDQLSWNATGTKVQKDWDVPRSKPRPIHNSASITTENNMIANELSVSLRQQLVWEHRRKLQSTTFLRRRHSDVHSLKQRAMNQRAEEGLHMGTEKDDSGFDFLDQGPAGYHSQGW